MVSSAVETEPVLEPEPEPSLPPSAISASYFALEDTQPIPQVPERPPEGAGATAIDLFHEEYGPAADGSIDLSVPERQQASPPPQFAGLDEDSILSELAPAAPPETQGAPPQTQPEPEPEPEPEPKSIFEPLHTQAPSYPQTPEPAPPAPSHEPPEPVELGHALPELPQGYEPAPAPVPVEPLPYHAEEPAPVYEPAPPAVEPIPEPEFHYAHEAAPVPEPPPMVEPAPVNEYSIIADYSYSESAPLDLSAMSPEIPAEPPAVEPEPPPLTEEEILQTAPHLVEAPAHEVAPPPPAPQTLRVEDHEFAAAMAAALDAAEREPSAEPPAAVHEAEPVQAVAAPEADEGLANLDRSYVAGVVQRVVDRYKTQIIADITRELMKHNQ